MFVIFSKQCKQNNLIMSNKSHCDLIGYKFFDFINNKTHYLMPKEMKYIHMQNQYPFNQTRHDFQSGQSSQVKKMIQYDSEPRFIIKEKIRMLKSLGFQNLIGLQSTTSEQNSITLYFQCVPNQFLTQKNGMNEDQMSKVYNGMLELCQSLASKSIIHDLDVKRVGLDKRFNVKYFLGIDFKIDKAADKQKTNQYYKSQISSVFVQFSKNGHNVSSNQHEKTIKQNVVKKISFAKPNKNETKFQINVKNVLNIDDNKQRKILKKSSIIDSKQQDIKARKASNRFTFNNDNHIQLPINDKTDQKQANKPLKIQELSIRINRLKGYMKEVTGKMCNRNVSPINTAKAVSGLNGDSININIIKTGESSSNQNSPQNKNRLTPTKFSKIEKKIAQFRTSKLAMTSNNEQNSNKNDNQTTVNHTDHKLKCNQAKSLQQNNKQVKNEALKNPQQTLFKTSDITQNFTADDGFKKNPFSFLDEDRQHKEYLMLANKDKYCQQFMNFLDDHNQPSLKSSAQDQKPPQDQAIRISSPFQKPQDSPRKKYAHLRQNLKTQSSDNALQIQNRVQKVIRSSLKLINGLRSRQTIRCQ